MVAFDGVALESGVTPLPIYPWEAVSADLGRVKEAFESLHLKASVRPVAARPGSPGTILAIGEKPNFICRYALVSSVDSPGLPYALRVVLQGLDDDRLVDEIDMLNEILGPGVKEIDETIQAKE